MYHNNERLILHKKPKLYPQPVCFNQTLQKKKTRWKCSSFTNKIQDIRNYKLAILWKKCTLGNIIDSAPNQVYLDTIPARGIDISSEHKNRSKI